MSEPYQLTLFAEDSPAKICHLQEEAQGLTDNGVDSGLSITASLRKPGPRGSSSRTSQPFDLADWTECSGRSLRSGMMRSGTVYPLPPLVPLTKETASGLWLTPTTGGLDGGSSFHKAAKARGMWPTPSSRDHKGGYIGGRIRNGKVSWDTLDVAVQYTDNQSKTGGQLNPTWVEWLMGFPIEHTDLSNSETPSSRKSLK